MEATPHRVPVEHHVDREVLSDVAKELDRRHLAGPRQVVLDDGSRWRVVEVDEALELPADSVGPIGDRGRVGQRAFPGLLGSPIIPVAPPASTIGR